VLLFGWVVRSDAAASPTVRVYVFAAGYLIVWGAFAVAMTLVQRELSLRAVMTAMMKLEAYRWSGALVVLAGLGCFWALMLLLFALGVMNLPVLVALFVILIAEKQAPPWIRADVAVGALLTAGGAWMLLR
jgi:predicted metal-binding membrane protein